MGALNVALTRQENHVIRGREELTATRDHPVTALTLFHREQLISVLKE